MTVRRHDLLFMKRKSGQRGPRGHRGLTGKVVSSTMKSPLGRPCSLFGAFVPFRAVSPSCSGCLGLPFRPTTGRMYRRSTGGFCTGGFSMGFSRCGGRAADWCRRGVFRRCNLACIKIHSPPRGPCGWSAHASARRDDITSSAALKALNLLTSGQTGNSQSDPSALAQIRHAGSQALMDTEWTGNARACTTTGTTASVRLDNSFIRVERRY
jgi:hypothetical protein